MKKLWLGGVVIASIGLTACGEAPDVAPEGQLATAAETPKTEARALPIPGVGGARQGSAAVDVGPLTWDKPADWNAVPPASTMRLAQYTVPGSGGDGECAVFYFGPGQGGDAMANARRWAGQFTHPDGSPSLDTMKVETLDGGPLGLTLVEAAGIYDGGMSMGAAPPERKEGWMLLGGIAEGPDAPWFFKFVGPEATVKENREAFVALLRSIRQEI